MVGAIVILTMTVATVGLAGLVLAPRLGRGSLVFEEAPDGPHPFGYRMSWLAVRTRDTARLAERLGLVEMRDVSWNNGLGMVYREGDGENPVFVSPPVNGWSFVVGLALPQPLGRSFIDKTTPLLVELGNHFIEVQYYLAYPALDCFGWARVVDGKLVRAYAITSDGVVLNKGRVTREEKLLGIKHHEVRGVTRRAGDGEGELILYPTEQHVLHLAGKWSLDPSRLTRLDGTPGRGLLCRPPASWRAERMLRSA